MRVLLTGGGSSGHVNPALAIADIIKARDSSATFAYVGTENGIEKRLVEKEGIPFYSVNIQGISRSLSPRNIKTAYLIISAPSKAKKIIEKFKPDVVIGTGGYVSWPSLKAAADMGIPTVIHESNSIPGLAVRKLEKSVDLLLTNFKQTAGGLKNPNKVVNVGNPIRTSFDGIDKQSARHKLGISDEIKFVILSFGGSLGAKAINSAAIDVMRNFSAKRDDVMHIHVGGKNYYKDAMEKFAMYSLEKNPRLKIQEYIYDMPLYMAAADVVICRAGAATLTELAMLSKPAILIPSPNVTDNHQYKNAKVLADKGAAQVIAESELDVQTSTDAVERIYSDSELAQKMSNAISEFANKDIGDKIYSQITALIKNKAKIKRKGK